MKRYIVTVEFETSIEAKDLEHAKEISAWDVLPEVPWHEHMTIREATKKERDWWKKEEEWQRQATKDLQE